MITAKLKKIAPLKPNAQLDVTKDDGKIETFELLEFEPGPNKRYMIAVEVGHMPPKEAWSYLSKMRDQLIKGGFFKEGTFLLAPMRGGEPQNGLYEIDVQ